MVVTMAIVMGLTWTVFLYGTWVVGFNLGVFEVFAATSAFGLAGLVAMSWFVLSRRMRRSAP